MHGNYSKNVQVVNSIFSEISNADSSCDKRQYYYEYRSVDGKFSYIQFLVILSVGAYTTLFILKKSYLETLRLLKETSLERILFQ
jgi:hypothetical protein